MDLKDWTDEELNDILAMAKKQLGDIEPLSVPADRIEAAMRVLDNSSFTMPRHNWKSFSQLLFDYVEKEISRRQEMAG